MEYGGRCSQAAACLFVMGLRSLQVVAEGREAKMALLWTSGHRRPAAAGASGEEDRIANVLVGQSCGLAAAVVDHLTE